MDRKLKSSEYEIVDIKIPYYNLYRSLIIASVAIGLVAFIIACFAIGGYIHHRPNVTMKNLTIKENLTHEEDSKVTVKTEHLDEEVITTHDLASINRVAPKVNVVNGIHSITSYHYISDPGTSDKFTNTSLMAKYLNYLCNSGNFRTPLNNSVAKQLLLHLAASDAVFRTPINAVDGNNTIMANANSVYLLTAGGIQAPSTLLIDGSVNTDARLLVFNPGNVFVTEGNNLTIRLSSGNFSNTSRIFVYRNSNNIALANSNDELAMFKPNNGNHVYPPENRQCNQITISGPNGFLIGKGSFILVRDVKETATGGVGDSDVRAHVTVFLVAQGSNPTNTVFS